MLLKIKYLAFSTIFILFLLVVTGSAQDSTARLDKSKADVSDKSSTAEKDSDSSSKEA